MLYRLYDETKLKNTSTDAAGFYTKVVDSDGVTKEVILINSKHADSPLSVGAILAHEMMHLYLFRLGLKLDDVEENELLTDLSTIETGLSLLILNGMHYSNEWWLTVIYLCFGTIYWREEEKAFGYFRPEEYGNHAIAHFRRLRIEMEQVVGFLNPPSRHFVKSSVTSSKQPTDYIRALENHYRKLRLRRGAVASCVVLLVLSFVHWSDSKKKELGAQIESCKNAITQLDANLKPEIDRLQELKKSLDSYEKASDVSHHNSLVDPYNALLSELRPKLLAQHQQIENCNKLIASWNSEYGRR